MGVFDFGLSGLAVGIWYLVFPDEKINLLVLCSGEDKYPRLFGYKSKY